MTILEEKATSQNTSSTTSRKQNNVSEDDNRNKIEKGGLIGSEINVNTHRRNSVNLDETLIRALSTSNNSAMISAVGDRYITPEYLAPLPSSTVRILNNILSHTTKNKNVSRLMHIYLQLHLNNLCNFIFFDSPLIPCLVVGGYVVLTTLVLPMVMKNREPFDLKNVLIVYNFIQVSNRQKCLVIMN